MVKRSILLIAAVLVLALLHAQGAKATQTWDMGSGSVLSSVVWSPKGDCLAFIAAGDESEEGEHSLLNAGIWTISLAKRGQPSRPHWLITRTRKQGIPVALFWLSNGRLGWAAAHFSEWESTFGFTQMGVSDKKPKRLVNRNFDGVQGTGEDAGWSAPEDVYFDASSGNLLFSGGILSYGTYVRILHIRDGKVQNLSLPRLPGESSPDDYLSSVTLWGSLKDFRKPVFYIAASVNSNTGGMQLWRSDSYSLKQTKLISTSGSFPRVSPDGKHLAWLEMSGDGKSYGVVIYNLGTGKRRVLATLASSWTDSSPGIGCPYSWSPDGKKIAYADGSRVKIITVRP